MTEAVKKAEIILEKLDKATGDSNTIDLYLDHRQLQLMCLNGNPGRFRLVEFGSFRGVKNFENISLGELRIRGLRTVGEEFGTSGNRKI
ncbi:MAG: hypothetical protein M1484_04820 [Patescibacteria group bacterium]|nr:hypothetical protein [Patescibacteria group bacterium]MCL5432377.1 hypothetical protein [Patescibacteria group bacterium]